MLAPAERADGTLALQPERDDRLLPGLKAEHRAGVQVAQRGQGGALAGMEGRDPLEALEAVAQLSSKPVLEEVHRRREELGPLRGRQHNRDGARRDRPACQSTVPQHAAVVGTRVRRHRRSKLRQHVCDRGVGRLAVPAVAAAERSKGRRLRQRQDLGLQVEREVVQQRRARCDV